MAVPLTTTTKIGMLGKFADRTQRRQFLLAHVGSKILKDHPGKNNYHGTGKGGSRRIPTFKRGKSRRLSKENWVAPYCITD